ncbi:helix-turn-helix domain-containing protein [Bilophila wadsworthia]|uniref:helix-turn-helix domain-containing protein n=1 Tax=Bilophila wadsworthia TaxID=35833 RepID=UPI003AB38D42
MWNRFHTAMDNDKTKVIMGLIVASLREGLGMSRYALAQEAGVDYSWLRRFEQGKSGIRVETLIGLAKGLGIPAGTLSARWRKRWKIPIRGLRSTSGKGSEGA